MIKQQSERLLLPAIIVVFEIFAILACNFLIGFVGMVILALSFHALFQMKYRAIALIVFLGIYAVSLALAYFGCLSLPSTLCNNAPNCHWSLNGLYITSTLLAISFAIISIRYNLPKKDVAK